MKWLNRVFNIKQPNKLNGCDPEIRKKREMDEREDNIKRRLDALEELAQTLKGQEHG